MVRRRVMRVAEQRRATSRLCWLALEAPEIARDARAGQYLMVRCTEQGAYDPPLRRPLAIAAAEPALGRIGLIYPPDEPGLAWVARAREGDELDTLGPIGRPFELGTRTRSLLLIGEGAGLAALLLLAREALGRGCAVTLLAGATDAALLPPPFLLPGEVEYQGAIGPALDLLVAPPRGEPAPLAWADQVCAAIPLEACARLATAIQRDRLRWDRGFASVLLPGPLPCGIGACGACLLETRRGMRMQCIDGPVFELRDIVR